MPISKYQTFYRQILSNVREIKKENCYEKDSQAFGHWFLEKRYRLSQQEIGEALIDGSDDCGIDSIYYQEDNKELTLIQFKFPSKEKNINTEIDEETILKLWNGFEKLLSDEELGRINEGFKRHRENLKDTEVFRYNLVFACFTGGLGQHAEESLQVKTKKFEKDNGSSINIEVYDKGKISDIFEKMNRNSSIEIKLHYNNLSPAYDVDKNKISSYIGVVQGKNLVEACKEHLHIIFDENIRLYEGDNNINESIRETATSMDSENFYFYNNGVVFICDNAENSVNSHTITLTGASVVNGCQTINSLVKACKDGNIKDDVYVLFRVIKISDYDQRAKITEKLNSQTQIKDSYFISNNSIVRKLQKDMKEKNCFLERQINEFEYQILYGKEKEGYKYIIPLEKAIQYYTGFWIDDLAALAKRGKAELFDKERINSILSEISAARVIHAYEWYMKISKVITLYRKMRRNNENNEFSKYLGITQEELLKNVDKYLFINTGDILLLNTVKCIENKNKEISECETIRRAIDICKDILLEEEFIGSASATVTKSSKTFRKMQVKINE